MRENGKEYEEIPSKSLYFFLSGVTLHNKWVKLLFDVICDLIYYWTDPGQHGTYLFDRKVTGFCKKVKWKIFHFTDRGETQKIFLRRNNDYLQTSCSARKLQQSLYSFSMYTVKPLVKADISRIFTHLLKWFPLSTILKKKGERKKKRKKWMKIQGVCFLTRSLWLVIVKGSCLNLYIIFVKYCFDRS